MGNMVPMLNWSEEKGEKPYSLISHFAEDSDYLKPSEAKFMINLRSMIWMPMSSN